MISFFLLSMIQCSGKIILLRGDHFLLQSLGSLPFGIVVLDCQRKKSLMAAVCLGILWGRHYGTTKFHQGFLDRSQSSQFDSRKNSVVLPSPIDCSLRDRLWRPAPLHSVHEALQCHLLCSSLCGILRHERFDQFGNALSHLCLATRNMERHHVPIWTIGTHDRCLFTRDDW